MQENQPGQKVSHFFNWGSFKKFFLIFFVLILLHEAKSLAAVKYSAGEEEKILQDLDARGLSQFGSSLESCSQVLGMILQKPYGDDTEANFGFCSRLYEGLITKAARSTERISARQKVRLLEASDRARDLISLLFKKTAQQNNGKVETTVPYRSTLTVLSNQLQEFSNLIFSKESWSARYSLGMGYLRTVDRRKLPLLTGQVSLDLDLGSSADARFILAAASDLREESGYTGYSTTRSDIVSLTEAWLMLKSSRNLRVKLGFFPDIDGIVSPKSWPFLSAQADFFLVNDRVFRWNLRLRHDSLATYSALSHKPTASLAERNFSQTLFSVRPRFNSLQNITTLGLGLHWYTDSDEQLQTLSYGRYEPLKMRIGQKNSRYRVSELTFKSYLEFETKMSTEVQFDIFRNFIVEDSGRGWYVGLKNVYQLAEGTRLHFDVSHSHIECMSVPPVQLSSRLIPGAAGTGFSSGAEFVFSKGYKLDFFAEALAFVRPLNSTSCRSEDNVSALGSLPRFNTGLKLTYEFFDDL